MALKTKSGVQVPNKCETDAEKMKLIKKTEFPISRSLNVHPCKFYGVSA